VGGGGIYGARICERIGGVGGGAESALKGGGVVRCLESCEGNGGGGGGEGMGWRRGEGQLMDKWEEKISVVIFHTSLNRAKSCRIWVGGGKGGGANEAFTCKCLAQSRDKIQLSTMYADRVKISSTEEKLSAIGNSSRFTGRYKKNAALKLSQHIHFLLE
jgi:hypothetical protein